MTTIKLTDVDRPNEPFEVEFLGIDKDQTTLALTVPNTLVRFALRRRDRSSLFEGSLGGRYYTYEFPARRQSVAQRR